MDKFWENYIKTRPADSKGAFEAFRKMNQEPRTGFKDGNGVYDEDTEKNLLGKRVRELMDEGYEFGEAVRQAMKEGYAKGGEAKNWIQDAVKKPGALRAVAENKIEETKGDFTNFLPISSRTCPIPTYPKSSPLYSSGIINEVHPISIISFHVDSSND